MKFLNLKGLIITLTIILTFTGCQENEDLSNIEKKELNRNEIISEFKSSLDYFRKNKVSHRNSKSFDRNKFNSEYAKNQKYLNNRTGLNLDFNENEINNITQALKEGIPLSDKEHLKRIELIKENGKYKVYLEAIKILEEVYSTNNSATSARMSWGCGIAIAGNFVATLGLSACITGAGCPLALAGKALALASLATSC